MGWPGGRVCAQDTSFPASGLLSSTTTYQQWVSVLVLVRVLSVQLTIMFRYYLSERNSGEKPYVLPVKGQLSQQFDVGAIAR